MLVYSIFFNLAEIIPDTEHKIKKITQDVILNVIKSCLEYLFNKAIKAKNIRKITNPDKSPDNIKEFDAEYVLTNSYFFSFVISLFNTMISPSFY